MPIVQDELWKHPGNPGMIVVHGHASILEDGRLWLDYGDAKEAIRRIPDIERQCGMLVSQSAVNGVYGFLPIRPSRPDQHLVGFGLFQTHLDPGAPADPELIKYSMDCLRQFATEHSNLKIRMNFPGLQSGLPVDEVTPLILPLPINVTVCHQGEIPRAVPENFIGFKALYIEIANLLKEGRYNQAVEYLVENGYDIQSAIEQVNAVQRIAKERSQRESQYVQHWRESRFPN